MEESIEAIRTELEQRLRFETPLAEIPFVNKNQTALMGWSHGGWTTLFALEERLLSKTEVILFDVQSLFILIAVSTYGTLIPRYRF